MNVGPRLPRVVLGAIAVPAHEILVDLGTPREEAFDACDSEDSESSDFE